MAQDQAKANPQTDSAQALEIDPRISENAESLKGWEAHELQRLFDECGGLHVVDLKKPIHRQVVCRPLQYELLRQALQADRVGNEPDNERIAKAFVNACVIRKEDREAIHEAGASALMFMYAQLVVYWQKRPIKVEKTTAKKLLGKDLETIQAYAGADVELLAYQVTDEQSGRIFQAVVKKPTTRAIFLAQNERVGPLYVAAQIVNHALLRECWISGDDQVHKYAHLSRAFYAQVIDPLLEEIEGESWGL